MCVCVFIRVMGGNIDFKDIRGEDRYSLSITAVQEVVLKQYWCRHIATFVFNFTF